jgi:hypothetical protein
MVSGNCFWCVMVALAVMSCHSNHNTLKQVPGSMMQALVPPALGIFSHPAISPYAVACGGVGDWGVVGW